MNILEEIRLLGIEPKRKSNAKGGEYHSECPRCEGDPSKQSDRFHVWPEQNNGDGSFWCRQCGKVGELIQFLSSLVGWVI
jgi:DNA primase